MTLSLTARRRPARLMRRQMSRRGIRGARRRARYDAVLGLHQAGESVQAISARLGLCRETVRKYVRAGALPEWPARRTVLSAGTTDAAHLQRRWAEGCRDATVLRKELRALGFPGSVRMVQNAVAGWREDHRPRPGALGATGTTPADEIVRMTARPQPSLRAPAVGVRPLAPAIFGGRGPADPFHRTDRGRAQSRIVPDPPSVGRPG